SGLEPPDDREAALVTTLSPGAYTAIVRGTNGLTGTALFELYDVDPANSRLSNISTRSRIGSDDQALIGGFIVQGDQITKVVVRAIGPSLTNFGVGGALSDPMLEVHDGNGALLAQDDDWRMYQDQRIEDTGVMRTDDRESEMMLLLEPGS